MNKFRKEVSDIVRERVACYDRWGRSIPPLLRGVFSAIEFEKAGFYADSVLLNDLHQFGGGQHVSDLRRALSESGLISNEKTMMALERVATMFELLESRWEQDISSLEQRVGQPLLCWPSLLKALISVRAVTELVGVRTTKILEIGPGSGYASLLLGFTGHRVASIDVSRGYGVWQSILYNFMNHYIKVRRIAGAVAPRALDPADAYSPRPSASLECELLIANHMLNEMSRHSLFCLLESLNRRDVSADILVEGWGLGSRLDKVKNAQTESILNYFGYKLRYHHPSLESGARAKPALRQKRHYVQLPVSLFIKSKTKGCKNVRLTGSLFRNLKMRDLKKPVLTQNKLSRTLKIVRNDSGGDTLASIYERFVLRDPKSGAPINRLESELLDYIGLNSNTVVPYVRGDSGRHF